MLVNDVRFLMISEFGVSEDVPQIGLLSWLQEMLKLLRGLFQTYFPVDAGNAFIYVISWKFRVRLLVRMNRVLR